MYSVVDFTFIMSGMQEELNEYVKSNYSEIYPWRDKPYYSIENDEYAGPDEVIDDIRSVQEAFPKKDFEVQGSVKYAGSGEYCEFKYFVKNGDIQFVQTPFYSIIEDFSEYDTADELLEAYPWLGQSFDSEKLQQWLNKHIEEVYYWGDKISENPPTEYYPVKED